MQPVTQELFPGIGEPYPVVDSGFDGELLGGVDHHRIALVSGGGPAGLMAAIALKYTGNFQHVLLLEKRSCYSRTNMVELKGAALLSVSKFGTGLVNRLTRSRADLEKSVTVFADRKYSIVAAWDAVLSAISNHHCIRNLSHDGVSFERVERESYRPGEFGYDTDFFNIDNVMSSQIKDLEHTLNLAALEAGVEIFSSSSAEFIPLEADSGMASALLSIRHSGTKDLRKILIRNPDLIVIAEGQSSINRSRLGVDYIRFPRTECWYHGTMRGRAAEGHSVIYIEPSEKSISSYIFNSKTACFHASVWTEDVLSGGDGRATLAAAVSRDRASGRIQAADWGGLLPGSDSALEICPGIAGKFVVGRNVLLLGDAAGAGSPVSAMGCTLALSAHIQALTDYVQSGRVEADRWLYSRSIFEAVCYWHHRSQKVLTDFGFLAKSYPEVRQKILRENFPERFFNESNFPQNGM